MNLSARYEKLKMKVGGNHEKQDYEFTATRMPEDRFHITRPSKANHRILSELHFALHLSERYDGKYDGEIEKALSLLENCMETEGVLTNSACKEAEAVLMPLKDASKEYEVMFASHAHIDMNWMWGWQETVAVTLSTFRTILNLMKEYPDFTFSQSQASVYKIVEEYRPSMMEEIKQRIAEGRWEVTANAWVETDKNMPDTESLIRHIKVTREYLRDVWGVENVKVDFSPDTFGHSRFVPEINSFGSVPYYYHCRGLQQEVTLYRYKAPSGKEVLMYKEPYWYNSGANHENGVFVFEMEKRCNGLKTALVVYGVGDHGGGPTRRDVESILEMMEWPIFPTFKFGTIQEFFEKAEAVRDGLPVVDHELNAIFTGCYTTQSRVKLGNRRAEAGLLDSERMSALSHCVLGTEYAPERYTKAWQNVLFNHFHDILTGSGVQETREFAMGKFAEAIACAQSEQSAAMEAISQNIDTSGFPSDDDIAFERSEGAGVGYGIANYAGVPNPERGAGKYRIYTIFNPSAMNRKEVVELTVWDYTGDLKRLEVIDHEGKQLAFQLKDKEPLMYWDHSYVRILVEAEVPAFGYATCAVCEKELTHYPIWMQHGDHEEYSKDAIVLENEKLYARFDTGSGMLNSLIDKKTGEELLSGPAGLHLAHTEDGGMTAWSIGRYLKVEPVVDTYKVEVVKGELRDSVTFKQKVMNSEVTVTVSLDKDADALAYDYTIDWREIRSAQEYIPLLTYRMPLKNGSDMIMTDVPAGTAFRKEKQMDVPALTGACAVTEGTTAALICDCKYGVRLADSVLTTTFINTSCDPDPYPERGIHAIKLFVALTEGCPTQLKRAGECLIRPMIGVPTGCHPGKLAAKASLLGFDAAHSVLTSVSMSADDALMIRFYENAGEADQIVIRPPFAPAKAVLTNLNEEELAAAVIEDGAVKFAVDPYSIAQVKIYA